MNSLLLAFFVVTNVGIVAGYLFIALRVVPHAAARLHRTRIGGTIFFATCAMTHTDLAIHALLGNGVTLQDMVSVHMLAIHGVQVIAVWMFVTGLYLEIVRWGPWSAGTGNPHAVDPHPR